MTGILDLEQDALVLICTLLPVRDLCTFSQACRRAWGAAQEVRCLFLEQINKNRSC